MKYGAWWEIPLHFSWFRGSRKEVLFISRNTPRARAIERKYERNWQLNLFEFCLCKQPQHRKTNRWVALISCQAYAYQNTLRTMYEIEGVCVCLCLYTKDRKWHVMDFVHKQRARAQVHEHKFNRKYNQCHYNVFSSSMCAKQARTFALRREKQNTYNFSSSPPPPSSSTEQNKIKCQYEPQHHRCHSTKERKRKIKWRRNRQIILRSRTLKSRTQPKYPQLSLVDERWVRKFNFEK